MAYHNGQSTITYGSKDGRSKNEFKAPARLAEIRKSHAARLTLTLEFLSEPHTIAEVSQELFGRVNGYNVLLAIEEAGAHVEYLHQRGQLRIINLDDFDKNDGPVVTLYQRNTGMVGKKID